MQHFRPPAALRKLQRNMHHWAFASRCDSARVEVIIVNTREKCDLQVRASPEPRKCVGRMSLSAALDCVRSPTFSLPPPPYPSSSSSLSLLLLLPLRLPPPLSPSDLWLSSGVVIFASAWYQRNICDRMMTTTWCFVSAWCWVMM